ncbi:aromatic ring-hydroxylating oxygenase subunit alpha [Gloeobacter violaceus]|uniref:Gll1922 protein n=1 Tax=Gloeobacter violaceus (strain ATCC 29082 / PCC 7421) TaxID=251221 RepID=Q7NJB0_GLOVI|nr:aromatic ring-hydroxylating dioxygenase subunit alpha [Gloeobacter violaceus]BAC89863.1 gll1922 [Gloeobacter violaceus PCC 7421]
MVRTLIDIRSLTIDPNCWYAVAQSAELKTEPRSITLWGEAIALFRGADGVAHAVEDRCPHRQVKLSHGRVVEGSLECAYHGWRFDGDGRCTHVPYREGSLPGCRLRTYPVREHDGFVWLFAGDPGRAHAVEPLRLPEWDHLNYIASVAPIACAAHYSYLIENLMDMHHGHLHERFQAWGAAHLEKLEEHPGRIDALYEAQSYYRIDRIWSVAQLFVPALRRAHPEALAVSYVYPHWRARLGEDFRLYCLLCPEGERSTRAYLVHFTSLEAFPDLHKLPVPFRRFVKDRCFGSAQGMLAGLIRQDVQMIEEEQRAYDRDPQRRNWEVNRSIAAVQRLWRQQKKADVS